MRVIMLIATFFVAACSNVKAGKDPAYDLADAAQANARTALSTNEDQETRIEDLESQVSSLESDLESLKLQVSALAQETDRLGKSEDILFKNDQILQGNMDKHRHY